MDDRPLRRGFLAHQLFVYMHLPIVVGITAIAAGTHLAIDAVTSGEANLPAGAVWAICGGAALFELATATIHAARHSARDWLVYERVLVTLALLGLAIVGTTLQLLVLLAILATVHVGQLITELTVHPLVRHA